MANPSFLNVSELSFDGLKDSLKTYLKGRPEFIDYDFEGSNLNALLDLLSYNTYMNSYYLNMVGSEMFLDSAQIKSSVVSHAKELNYTPRSRTSARAEVIFTVNPNGGSPKTIVIQENYILRATVNNTTLEFSTDSALTVYPDATGNYISDPVYVYEGKIVDEYFTNVTTSTKFILKSENIDTNSIKVNVTDSATNFANLNYTLAESLYGLNSNSLVYFVQGYNSNQYEVVFGDGVFGKAIANGNIVHVKYRSTNGELGNKVKTFSTSNKIGGTYSVTVATNVAAAQGSERETLDSIKFYAPRHFTNQNRAVTRDDYINLVRERYPQITAINVYGGEDAVPPLYGKVVLTMIPTGNDPLIPDDIKNDIINYLTTKTITVQPVIVDPEYLYVDIYTDVYYNPSLTTKSQQQLKSDVLSQIQAYDSLYLTDFGNDLRGSKLLSYIDSADGSIVSNQTYLKIIYKITPKKTVYTDYTIDLNNPLNRQVLTAYGPGEEPVILSSSFYYVLNNTIYNNCRLQDDGNGNLNVFANIGGSYSLIDKNIGTVDYSTGVLKFYISIYDYTNNINIFAKPLTTDIVVSNNKFLKIDYTNVFVGVNTFRQ